MGFAELAARYRAYAAQCVGVAQSMEGEAEKLLLLDMAQTWIDLAKHAETNQAVFAVHEEARD